MRSAYGIWNFNFWIVLQIHPSCLPHRTRSDLPRRCDLQGYVLSQCCVELFFRTSLWSHHLIECVCVCWRILKDFFRLGFYKDLFQFRVTILGVVPLLRCANNDQKLPILFFFINWGKQNWRTDWLRVRTVGWLSLIIIAGTHRFPNVPLICHINIGDYRWLRHSSRS